MSSFGPNPFSRRPGGYPLDYGADAGSPAVVTFFNSVYAWMAAGLGLTAVVGWWVSHNPQAMVSIFRTGPMIMLCVAEIALVVVISSAIHRISATVATVLFLAFAALNGLTLGGIFIVYTGASIAGAFIACTAMFGAVSVYGMVTQTDLTRFGTFFFMALIGVVVASVANFFLHSTMLTWVVSYAGVALFVGLTAYDTQRLRQIALSTAGDQAMASRLSVSGALMLYLDFLNLFLFLLQIMGQERQR